MQHSFGLRTNLNLNPFKRVDVLRINDEEKLIVPLKPGETNIQYYVTYKNFTVYYMKLSPEWASMQEHVCLKSCDLNINILDLKL